jgi:alkylation response protein AidB-like acyl-CoA dehydrogenase
VAASRRGCVEIDIAISAGSLIECRDCGEEDLMETSFDARTEAFRDEVRRFIRENLPEDIRAAVAGERMDLPADYQRQWQRILADKGWGAPSWPKEHGGAGWTDQQFYIFERELALNDAPRPLGFGIQMLGPTLLEFGTEDQKKRFLPGTLNGDILWCQGYSEPNAGSDLASLKTRAVLDCNHYVINGSKIWTTDAHHADWMFGLFRTDSSGRKQEGITFLLLDMKSPGVTVRPIIMFEGTHEVNQVFFDDVRVPVGQLVGEAGKGWTIAKYLLGLERFGTAEVSRTLASIGRLRRLAARIPAGEGTLFDDPDFSARMADAEMELRALELTELRFLFAPGGADAMGAEASMLKIRGTEIQQEVFGLTVEALGLYAQVAPDIDDAAHPAELAAEFRRGANASRTHFNFRKTSIYAGSNEIQKNIIAKAVLGLGR